MMVVIIKIRYVSTHGHTRKEMNFILPLNMQFLLVPLAKQQSPWYGQNSPGMQPSIV